MTTYRTIIKDRDYDTIVSILKGIISSLTLVISLLDRLEREKEIISLSAES